MLNRIEMIVTEMIGQQIKKENELNELLEKLIFDNYGYVYEVRRIPITKEAFSTYQQSLEERVNAGILRDGGQYSDASLANYCKDMQLPNGKNVNVNIGLYVVGRSSSNYTYRM